DLTGVWKNLGGVFEPYLSQLRTKLRGQLLAYLRDKNIPPRAHLFINALHLVYTTPALTPGQFPYQ
ncbi:hypothetical protein ACEE86_13690, partial [Proteus mirabilis]